MTETVCPGNPDGVHGWALMGGGKACLYCDAWVARRTTLSVDTPQ